MAKKYQNLGWLGKKSSLSLLGMDGFDKKPSLRLDRAILGRGGEIWVEVRFFLSKKGRVEATRTRNKLMVKSFANRFHTIQVHVLSLWFFKKYYSTMMAHKIYK